jgi:phage repressor protein C with HTH and peptisase S24 domain
VIKKFGIDKCMAFSKRLNYALDLRKYPKLGQGRIGYVQEVFSLSRAGVNKWLHGKAIPHKNTRTLIAETLGISLKWLETGDGDPLAIDATKFEAHNKVIAIPLITMAEAYSLENIVEPNHFKERIVISAHIKADFAVILAGNSMFPRFQEGSILIINTKKDIKDGDYVLAKTSLLPEAIFRQYMVGTNGAYLTAFNQKFEPLYIDEHVKILGKIIEIRTSL